MIIGVIAANQFELETRFPQPSCVTSNFNEQIMIEAQAVRGEWQEEDNSRNINVLPVTPRRSRFCRVSFVNPAPVKGFTAREGRGYLILCPVSPNEASKSHRPHRLTKYFVPER
jgi:hypothetical protein